jgi:hypothetical protein
VPKKEDCTYNFDIALNFSQASGTGFKVYLNGRVFDTKIEILSSTDMNIRRSAEPKEKSSPTDCDHQHPSVQIQIIKRRRDTQHAGRGG